MMMPSREDDDDFEESDDDDDDESDDEEWDLGFLEPIEDSPRGKKRTHAIYFPSKVGGHPEWVDPRVHPKTILDQKEETTTTGQKRIMDFLLQIYAANEDNANAFHRTIYVFTSARGDKLGEEGRVRAFRSQLGRENAFYGMHPAPENPEDPRVDALIEEYEAKKLAADAEAKMRVCDDGRRDETKKTNSNGSGRGNENTTYPEFEIVVEPESDDDDASCSSIDSDVVDAKNANKSTNKKKIFQSIGDEAITENDLKEIASGVIDSDAQRLATFSVKLSKFPDQVLRYCPAPTAKAMWPSKSLAPDDSAIPDCPICKSKRRFEFQILPTLVSFIVPKESVEFNDTTLDFGSIAVYTCSKSCALDGEYAEEFVLVHPPMNS
mmetsp:Transcript_5042/g.14989  ORF Transcript_5042/g.14989 Transcript_5042/m.14989 type:complete len:380 (+) Transcript_5042:138-1277(+)